MTKYQKRHRIIATFFLLIFFPTLLPNNLFASTNGPKSPEAASFEPVDATDMVNLITGQYSYVLPLLNVPSPEGGYPLAMAYHAGIALDQEASWTGLGWNVNPGAIDRNVNGYPDDYSTNYINEYFYDSGGQQTVSMISLSYSYMGASVGVGFNWGSNQALGGYVGAGIGYKVGSVEVGLNAQTGTSGSSVGVGAKFAGGLTVGADYSTNDGLSAKAGFINSNGAGFSISSSGTGFINYGAGTGINFSSSGAHVTVMGSGIGMNTSFKNTVSMGDYSTSSSGWMVPLAMPLYGGVFSLTFGKQKFSYWLNKNERNVVTGPLNFHLTKFRVDWYDPATERPSGRPRYSVSGTDYFETEAQANDFITQYKSLHSTYVFNLFNTGTNFFSGYRDKFFDINEISVDQNSITSELKVDDNNMTFPSYDNFNVQAQGLSGGIKATLFENGALFGLSDKVNSSGFSLKYYNNISSEIIPSNALFNDRPNFYFENEISTYLAVNPETFNLNTNNTKIYSHSTGNAEANAKPRMKKSNFIEYYTNRAIKNSYNLLKNQGFLKPKVSGFDRDSLPLNSVGAFKITAVDGKTYHYSLPVYNHETITRTSGVITQRQDESQAYFEKRQLEPYATHWLLTAVTGPDFVDNGDGIAGDGDLGYWTSFEYGKWTDAFIWKAPYKKDYIRDESNPKIKTWIRGRKELYYLDKVKTRTHTALFIKSERSDSPSDSWEYKSVVQGGNFNPGPYVGRMTIPSQKQLKLDKIILLKNADDISDKTYGADQNLSININYNKNFPNEACKHRDCYLPEYSENKRALAKYNIKNNVLDDEDNWSLCIPKAIKVIDLNYDTTLIPGDNRLTLKNVSFKGKSGNSILPPYKFDYNNVNVPFNIDNKDGWGYLLNKPAAYSLNKITTPQGGTININYESNQFKSVTDVNLEFSNESLPYNAYGPTTSTTGGVTETSLVISINNQNTYPNLLNRTVNINYSEEICNTSLSTTSTYLNYNGTGHVVQDLGSGKFKVKFDGNIESNEGRNCDPNSYEYQYHVYMQDPTILKVSLDLNGQTYVSGGPRVASLKVSDEINSYITSYKYGENENGTGYVTYVPYAQNVTKNIPYSAELPSPRVMYDYVSISTYKEGASSSMGKIRYKFNIIKNKTSGQIKYGDFYEIIKSGNSLTNTSGIDVNVSSFTVKDNLASIGQLLEVTTFNGLGQELSKIKNTYYSTADNSNNMGVSQESYQTYKTVDYVTNSPSIKDKWIINSSTRIKYPNIIKSSTEQKNGYTYTTEFLDYDLVSGVSKETKFSSSDGQVFKTKKVPAYIKYPSMGSKVDDINNKNMLSQLAINSSYIYDKNDVTKPWKETSVGITTWSNLWSYKDIAGNVISPTALNEKIWRKHKSYTWNGVKDINGIFQNYDTTTGSSDDKFDWTIGVGQQPQWKQISEITSYDHYSSILEVKDINNNYNSTKMGDNNTKIIATGNARYDEMFYTSAENTPLTNFPTYLEPGISFENTFRNSSNSHTGKFSIAVLSNSKFGVLLKKGNEKTGKYKVSVWVEKTNAGKVRINNNNTLVDFTESYTAGNWVLKSGYVDVSAGQHSIYIVSTDTSTIYVDDLMIRRISSTITGYVYNEWDELTYIIGNNGLATRFEYDKGGKLIRTYSEIIDDLRNGVTGGFKLVKSNTYNNKFF